MEPQQLGYRPALDGIRAVAIVLVLALHGRFLSSGFLGVDIFFVLSGFLITALLLREWERTQAISLRHFYVRRARRLLPAVGALLVGVGLIYLALPHVRRGIGYWPSVAAVVGYGANWVMALTSARHPNPLGLFGHTWSLGIEEQFYIVWPLVLVLVLRCGWRRTLVADALAVAAVGSAVAAYFVWRRTYNTAVFDRTDTHAFGLLLGCAGALLVVRPDGVGFARVVRRREVGVLAAGALVAVIASIRPDVSPRFFVLWPLVSAIAAVLILHVLLDASGPIARLLSIRPLVWIGVRSYSLYLYHVPIFFAVAPQSVGLGKYSFFAVVASLSMLAAAVSFRFIERPFLLRFQYPRIASDQAAQSGPPVGRGAYGRSAV